MGRPFTASWLAGEPAATSFLPRAFADSDARRRAVEAARPISTDVFATLAAQEATRPASPARAHNLQRLRDGAAAVVTGQQVGLFLGPLYTLHKAASAIVNARALEAETGRAVVPVFWIQSEDHDFAEVRSCDVIGASGLVTLTLDDELGAQARVPVAERRLGASVERALDELQRALQGPHADAVVALLRRYYRAERTLPEAFGDTIAELFADHGLLVLDPRPAFVTHARPVHAFAVREADALAASLGERTRALDAAGFDVQVPVRAGASLSCMAQDGQRVRVEGVVAEAMEVLEREPERFTTTALLRPLLQDTLLPTAGYVGGPGELAYFAELPPLYAHAGRVMPLAIPRARFKLVTATARRLGEQLGLAVEDASFSRRELMQRLASGREALVALEGVFARMDKQLEDGFSELAVHAQELGDTGFGKHGKKTEELLRSALDKLLDRSRRIAVESDTLVSERLDRFLNLLAPRGEPQERVLGFASFAAQVGVAGPGSLVDRVVAAVTPFDGSLRTVEL